MRSHLTTRSDCRGAAPVQRHDNQNERLCIGYLHKVRTDPRTPVIVGAGQFLNRVDHGADPLEPTDLILEATGRAESNAAPGIPVLGNLQLVAAVNMISWRYNDPGRIVAEHLGAKEAQTWYPAVGGNTPLMMLNRICTQIADGQLDSALLCGAEAWNTRTNAKRSGNRPEWTVQDASVVPDWGSEDTFTLGHPAEHALGIVAPVQAYPLFETALIHDVLSEHPDRSIQQQLDQVGEMWSGFSRVAAANPNAWNRKELNAREIVTATPDNRFVGWPYTKRMVSDPNVDMGSALIVMSAETAESAGINRDLWIFPWSGTDGIDLVMSERESFVRSPAIGVAGRRCLELSGVGLEDVELLDVYSCFPSAVQLFCREFELDPLSRPLSVYGGLAFGGGPWNNPVGHALATMVERLRESSGASSDEGAGAPQGTLGLVTGNGGHLDKHSFGLLGTNPPPHGFRHDRPQAEIDASTTAREVLTGHAGPATIEGWTVMYDRANEPTRYLGSCLTSEGARVWTASTEPDLMAAAVSSDLGGQSARVEPDGAIHLD